MRKMRMLTNDEWDRIVDPNERNPAAVVKEISRASGLPRSALRIMRRVSLRKMKEIKAWLDGLPQK
jgi:predicted transcriptional regulator